MPRKRNLSPPSYCLHKASGRAVVRIDSRDHYLGPHGTPESHAEYERHILEWRVNRSKQVERRESQSQTIDPALIISEVICRYRGFACGYYVMDGKPTKELGEMGLALRPLRKLYGSAFARDFGPLDLKEVRQHMIEVEDLSRGVINNRVNRIKRFFKWAVSEQLIPPSVVQGLTTVTGLRRGRTTAREMPPVKPVPDVWVEIVLPHLNPQVAAMVQVQRLTGMRPGEVVLMRACDIDMTGDVWVFTPLTHKNEWRDQSRFIPLGPKAQKIIRSLLTMSTGRYLFSPREA